MLIAFGQDQRRAALANRLYHVLADQPIALVVGDDRADAEAFEVVARERTEGRLAASLLLGVRGAREVPSELLAAADFILPEPEATALVLRALARALEAEDRAGR